MFETIEYPQVLTGEELDAYLARGWYRMGQSIYTTDYVMFEHRVYRTIWLRHILKNYSGGKSFDKLRKRNRHFDVEFKEAEITPEQEALFQKYRKAMPFEPAPSLNQLLNGYVFDPADIYATFQICIYDESKLIACTYFDIGNTSAEGISAFYDPDYTANSLGRYLIYLQIDLCCLLGFTHYYPGYFVPGYAHLDYKLAIGKSSLEYYHKKDMNWYPMSEYIDEGISLNWGDEIWPDDELEDNPLNDEEE